MRKQFCNHGEFLLFINASHGGYVHESDMQQTHTAREAACEADENVKQIIRFDRFNLNTEDVTEEVAKAWLDAEQMNPSESHKFPLYVRNSEALDTYTKEWDEAKADLRQMQAQGVA